MQQWGQSAVAAIATGATLWLQTDPEPTEYGDYRLVHQAESHYGWVRVVDDRERRVRWMLSDASVISALAARHARAGT